MKEVTTFAFVQINKESGLSQVHFTWTGTYVRKAAAFLWPKEIFVLIDRDCVSTCLFEVAELARLGHRLHGPSEEELSDTYQKKKWQ